jgi:hypothetical protein
MGMPTDIGVIDCMIGFPAEDVKSKYDFMRPAFRDKDSREEFTFPVRGSPSSASTWATSTRSATTSPT